MSKINLILINKTTAFVLLIFFCVYIDKLKVINI